MQNVAHVVLGGNIQPYTMSLEAFAKWAKTGRLVGVVFGLTTLRWGVPTAMAHVTEVAYSALFPKADSCPANRPCSEWTAGLRKN